MPLEHLRCFGGPSAICLLLCYSQKSGGVHSSSVGQPQCCHEGLCLWQGFAMGCHRLRCCSHPAGTKEATTTLHVLTLLRDLLPCFPAAVVKTCCETLLRIMTLSHVVSVPVPGVARAAPFPLGCALEGLEPPCLPAGSLEMQNVNVEEPRAAVLLACLLWKREAVAAVLGFPRQSLLWGRAAEGVKGCCLLWNPHSDAMSFAAGDSMCYASLPQPLQRPGQRGLPAGRAECPDHHREYGALAQGGTGLAVLQRPPTHPLLPQALYDYVPSTSDLQPLLTWLSTMERAHINLGR